MEDSASAATSVFKPAHCKMPQLIVIDTENYTIFETNQQHHVIIFT